MLALNHNYEISLIVIGNNNYKKHSFIANYHYVPMPSLVTQIFSIIKYALVLKKLPIQTCLYWSKQNKNRIDDIVENLNPDVICCEMIRTAIFGKNLKYKTFLDLADLLSRRYYQQLFEKGKISKIAGQYEKSFSGFLKKIINYPVIQKFILKIETELLRKYESSTPLFFDSVSLVSLKEVKMLKKSSKKNNIYWLPNGVDKIVKSDIDNYHINNFKIITFIGILDNPHNEHGIIYFLDEIFPNIKKRVPDVILQILGRNPTNLLLSKTKKMNDVFVPGFVENIEKYIQKSSVTIIPLRIGSGVKTKIFESLKYGIPVVSTTLGAEGVIPELKNYIFIKDNINDFSNCCIQLLNNEIDTRKIHNKAPRIIDSYYSWEKIGNRLENIIK